MSSVSWPKRAGDEPNCYAPLEIASGRLGRHEHIYFRGTDDGRLIKIGWSDRPVKKRQQEHAKSDTFGRSAADVLLALVRAERGTEKHIHAYFRPYLAVNGKHEVFHASTVIPYLTWLRDQYFVSVAEAEFYTEAGQTVIEPRFWLPTSGRTSERRREPDLFQHEHPWSFLPSRITTGDDYYTPVRIVDCAREALGGVIDLDPASHVQANNVVKAVRFYTKDENGLTLPWAGHVWLNPPFSKMAEWAAKAVEEANHLDAIVVLGATRMLTAQYLDPLLRLSRALCIVTGREGFWGIATDSNSPPSGFFLLYIGRDVQRFLVAVKSLGPVWIRP